MLYQPALRPDQITALYHLKCALKRPMTKIVRDITTDQLRRGVFTSVPDLIDTIDRYIAHHNKNQKPF